jgi:hypothetical protein
LEQIPELVQNFKIPTERASPNIVNGQKVFTQTIRAVSDQVSRIPPIDLVYFDPGSGRYVTAQTEPIPIKVLPTRVLTGKDAGARPEDVGQVSQIEAIRQGLAANYDDLGILHNQAPAGVAAFVSPLPLATWAGPLAILVSSLLIKITFQTRASRQALRRRRQAGGRAIKRLKIAARTRDLDCAADALRDFIADRFGRNPGALTPIDCHQIILAATADQGLADGFQSLMGKLEEARYGIADPTVMSEQWLSGAVDLIRRIDKRSGR